MKSVYPRISVLVISYNQENVIGRALDSLLSQKDYIYEICISDDCSKDHTWEIINLYSEKNPGLFKLNRNNVNLGIFKNIEKTWTMPTGDLVYQLSGDDECGEGWFKEVIKYVSSNNIDYINNKICIYGDFKAVYPKGDSFIYRNKLIQSRYTPLKLAIRGLIFNRSSLISKNAMDLFIEVSNGRSYAVEDAQDRQHQMFCSHNYYIPFVGNIYYTRIGVSAQMNAKAIHERKERIPYLKKTIRQAGIALDQKDNAYLDYIWCKDNNGETYISQKMRSIELGLFFHQLHIKRLLFALLIRIPHSRPIKNMRV